MRIFVISLTGLLLILFVSSEASAQNGRFEPQHFLSGYHLVSGKILHGLGNYEQAEKEFNKALNLGGYNEEAYYELGKLYYERSVRETKPELRMFYQRKSFDTFGRFLVSAGHPKNGSDIAKHNEAKQLRNLMEFQIRPIEPVVFSRPTTNGESEQEEESSLENSFSLTEEGDELRWHNEPVEGFHEPLAVHRGSDGLHSVTEKGDAFYRKKPFTIPIKGEVYLVSKGNGVKRKAGSRRLNQNWMVGL